MAAGSGIEDDQSRFLTLVLPHTKLCCCTGTAGLGEKKVFFSRKKLRVDDDAREGFRSYSRGRAGRLLRKG